MDEILVNGVKFVPKNSVDVSKMVCVRCRDSGVHVGELVSRDGQEVTLQNSRQIWRWKGANTLKELCENGVNRDSYTRISTIKTTKTILLDAISIDEITPGAAATLEPVWNT